MTAGNDTMGVYLIRHEQAERFADGGDHNRALTAFGRLRMKKTAPFLAQQDGLIDTVFTSPLVRAVQTAEILAAGIGVDLVTAQPTIAHPPSLRALVQLIDGVPANTAGLAIVGHEPTLSMLATHLIGDDAAQVWPGFTTGQVVALERNRTLNTWTFRWLIQPDGPKRVDSLGG